MTYECSSCGVLERIPEGNPPTCGDCGGMLDPKAVEREATLRGFEEMIDLLRREPELDLPSVHFTIWEISREDFRKTARLLGKTTKHMDGSYVSLRREFSGGVRLEVTIGKESICERVVVGSRWIPPSEGHTREEIEWVCRDSILADPADGV